MAAIIGAHHTSFTVADLERSLEFFRDVLGLEIVFVREVRDEYFGRIVGLPGAVVKAALLRIPGTGHHIELFEYLRPRGQAHRPRPCDPGSAHLSLLVNDLPKLCAELQAKGVSFTSDPVRIDVGPNLGGYGIYLSDPNGILIELFQQPGRASP
jgi:catechol 2,3-dioxygenase-like lactoylglutathione lyase family enzyme